MALTTTELSRYMDQCGVTPAGIAAIGRAMSGPPLRRVGSGRANWTGVIRSWKAGVPVEVESLDELAVQRELEADHQVLSYRSQAVQLTGRGRAKSGRRRKMVTIVDFLALYRVGPTLIEVKAPHDLERLMRLWPTEWICEGGRYRCLAFEAAAAELGLTYQVRTPAEINPVLAENLEILKEYLAPPTYPVSELERRTALEVFDDRLCVTLRELLAIKDLPADATYQLISDGALWVDLASERLPEIDRVRVYRDLEAATAIATAVNGALPGLVRQFIRRRKGTQVTILGTPMKIEVVGPDGILLSDDFGELQTFTAAQFEHLESTGRMVSVDPEGDLAAVIADDVLETMHPDAYIEAARRKAELDGVTDHRELGRPPRGERQHRRWKELIGPALVFGGDVIRALQPGKRGGSQGDRLGDRRPIVEEYAQKFLDKKLTTIADAWNQCLDALGKDRTVSYSTFWGFCQQPGKKKIVRARKGAGGSYKFEVKHWYLEQGVPRHGDFSFHMVHIDHTELSIFLRHPLLPILLGKVWITLAVDAYSRMPLGMYLSFDKPSWRSVMMVLRDMVRRHERLPQRLIVDHGREFKSLWLRAFAWCWGIELFWRPKRHPRAGTIQERMFGTVESMLAGLPGYSALLKEPRSVLKDADPRLHAALSLHHLDSYLEGRLFKLYASTRHSTLAIEPKVLFAEGKAILGERPHRRVKYDDEFRRTTLQPAGKRLVGDQGVSFRNGQYMGPVFEFPYFAAARSEGRRAVRIFCDPWNTQVLYIEFDGRLWPTTLQTPVPFRARTEKEYRTASAEFTRRLKIAHEFVPHEHKLVGRWVRDHARMFNSLPANQCMQRLKDEELFALWEGKDGSLAHQPPAAPTAPDARLAVAKSTISWTLEGVTAV
jgi:transposase InsO family protein